MLTLEWLNEVWERYGEEARRPVKRFAIGQNQLEVGKRPLLMGVINLSPQSWYRESVCLSREAAVRRGKVLADQGADIIDVGSESTLSHAERVSHDAQIEAVVPIVRELACAGIHISVETYSDQVALAALDAGAVVINMTGIGRNESVYQLAASYGAAVIISYVQGEDVRSVGNLEFDGDPFHDFRKYFEIQIRIAASQSLKKLFLDPGMGFYYRNLQDGRRRVRYQMETLLQTFRLGSLGFPVCHALPHAFDFFGEEVRVAEPFFAVLAALGKTHLFRTHEVARVKSVLDTLQSFGSDEADGLAEAFVDD